MIDERKWQILEAIIREYIMTAEPVGSRTLTRRYDLGVSAATIRNEMADLEDLGYLEQPHTSSGRIPSDKGYRSFVDSILKERDFPTISEEVQQTFSIKKRQIQDLIQETTKMLSHTTHYISVGMVPDVEKTVFQHLQLVPLGDKSIVAVVVTDTGLVQHEVLSLPVSMDRKELGQISEFLNDRLQGMTLQEIDHSLMKGIELELVNRYDVLSDVIQMLYAELLGDVNRKLQQLFLDGTSYMMEQPEFADINKLKSVMNLMEQREILALMLKQNFEETKSGIHVSIGQENTLESLKNCSLVSATYSVNGRPMGRIGILGPTRMEYGKVISLLQYVTNLLTKTLSKDEE